MLIPWNDKKHVHKVCLENNWYNEVLVMFPWNNINTSYK